jgi:hypothetical protein
LKIKSHDHVGENVNPLKPGMSGKDLRKFEDPGQDHGQKTDEIKNLRFPRSSPQRKKEMKSIPYGVP